MIFMISSNDQQHHPLQGVSGFASIAMRRTKLQQQQMPLRTVLFSSPQTTTELENEEPLSVIFQRAVVLQRAGSHEEALREYEFFLKAAQQCNVDPFRYAEVYGNMGALYLRQQNYEAARHHLLKALSYRPKLGTAHVNLAVVALQQASMANPPNSGRQLVEQAQEHCQDALEANADPRSVAMAKRLLEDIHRMLSSSSSSSSSPTG